MGAAGSVRLLYALHPPPTLPPPPPQTPYKIVRAALEGLRRSAHEAQRAAGRNAAATDNGQRRRVQAVLSETVMA